MRRNVHAAFCIAGLAACGSRRERRATRLPGRCRGVAQRATRRFAQAMQRIPTRRATRTEEFRMRIGRIRQTPRRARRWPPAFVHARFGRSGLLARVHIYAARDGDGSQRQRRRSEACARRPHSAQTADAADAGERAGAGWRAGWRAGVGRGRAIREAVRRLARRRSFAARGAVETSAGYGVTRTASDGLRLGGVVLLALRRSVLALTCWRRTDD